jgi:cobalt-zinc-cadmium efflux system protein
MGHDHPHRHPATVSRKLVVAAAVTGSFVMVELVAGLFAGSLALIGDALHNFTDALSLILALVAVRLAQRPPDDVKSFGYQRAGILAAFINAGTLVAFTIYLIIEAVDRFRHPHPVDTRLMIAVASVAIVMNSLLTLSLRHEGRHDLNIRGAVLHLLGDAVSSAGIVVAAILIRVTGAAIWDTAVSLLIGALIFWSSWGILRETVNLLLEGTPSGIDPAAVARALERIEGVSGVHHLHIWALGPTSPALSCHLMVGDVPIRNTAGMLEQVNALLQREYRIVHATVQFEFARCTDGDPFCVPYTAERDAH